MKTKPLFITFLSVVTLMGCHSGPVKTDTKAAAEKPKELVLIFNHAPQKRFFTLPSGGQSGTLPNSLISYIDSNGIQQEYSPRKAIDTLTIKNIKGPYLEVLYKFQGLEDVYYLFRKGDTIAFTYGKDLYPHVRSHTSQRLTKQYNFQANIKDRLSKFGFESFTLLTWETLRTFMQLKAERPDLYNKLFSRREADFMSVDTLRKQFQSYLRHYQNNLDSLYQNKALSTTYYEYYSYLLKRKKAEALVNDYLYASRKAKPSVHDHIYTDENNQVQQISALFRGFLNDSLMPYISYDRVVNGFVWDVLQKEKNVKVFQGRNRIYSDSRQMFENLDTLKNIPTETKNLLRFYCLEDIIEEFPVADKQLYLSKYTQLTRDSIKARYLINKYNLNFKTSNDLLLKSEQGLQLTLKEVLQQNKGKVIYIDFWASWCGPCLRSMPAARKLREAYKNKKVAFIYLAKNDEEKAWKKAIGRAETNYLGTNYFIVNSNVSKLLDEWKVYSIPRYMIFDKKGRLVNSKAPGPGSKTIRMLLNKYLKDRKTQAGALVVRDK